MKWFEPGRADVRVRVKVKTTETSVVVVVGNVAIFKSPSTSPDL